MAASRPRAFLDVSIAAQPAGRLVIELFNDQTPRTCENFLALCNGSHKDLTYALSPFHRVIDEFMIQGGDITAGDGTGGDSIYGGEFADENLTWREMDAAGLVCMANRGPDTNSSQFFVTLEPCPHLNGKHTIFGRLVAGQDVLDTIAKLDVDKNDRPKQPVLISRCGQLEKKAKKPVPRSPSPQRERSVTPRGRSPTRSPSRSMSPRKDRHARDRSPERKRRDRSNSHARDDRKRNRSREHHARRSDDRRDRRSRSRSPRRRRSYSRERDQRGHDHRRGPRGYDERGPRHDSQRWRGGRQGGDSYRPRPNGSGRLTATDDGGNSEGIVFKGRGAMKYRER